MRLGPILVPVAIVVSFGVILAAQEGWLDGGGNEPTFVRADAAIHGTPAARSNASTQPMALGRSVGKDADIVPPNAKAAARGAGGASLDSDGAALPATPAASDASAQNALQQARDEAAKAKQDVLDVTQASLSAQKASEAEFERQKTELNEQIAALRGKLDHPVATATGTDSAAKAEAEVATARAELADARGRETDLRTKLAALQGARTAAQAQPDTAKADLDKADAAEAEKAAKDAAASADRALAEADGRAKTLTRRVAALEAELTTNATTAKLVTAKAETADRLRAELVSERQSGEALLKQVAALKVAIGDSASKKTHAVAALQKQLEDSGKREADLNAKLASLREDAAASDDRTRQNQASAKQDLAELTKAAAKQAKTAADHIKTLETQLEAARAQETTLGAQVSALQGEIAAKAKVATAADATDHTQTSDSQAVVTLRDDLAGARRGQDVLRKENGVLQRELAEARADAKRLGDTLAQEQDDQGLPASPSGKSRGKGRPTRGEKTSQADQSEHERLVAQLDALKREQMRQEITALKIEAAHLPSARYERSARTVEPGQGSRFVGGVWPDYPRKERRESRRREARHQRDATRITPSRTSRSASSRRSPQGADQQTAIAQATGLIQSGDIDQARQLLRSQGTPAATRALADSYNPLTNTKYGAIGVDSDADKAMYLYRQAARESERR